MTSFMDRIRSEVSNEVDELVVTLRDSQLPTLLVEGYSDVRIYARWVSLRLLGTYNIDVRAVGGREKLLGVYDRRDEFPHVPVAFVSDRSMWLFTEVPVNYKDIVLTEGFSLENDLYTDAEPELKRLLDSHELKEYQQVLDSLCKWFAFEVEEYLSGNPIRGSVRLQDVIPSGQTELDTDFCRFRGFRPPNFQLIQQIRDNYQLKLPGKLLFEVLARYLDNPDRGFRFNIGSDGLYHIALSMPESHPKMDRLMQEVKKKLNKSETRKDEFFEKHGELSTGGIPKQVNTID